MFSIINNIGSFGKFNMQVFSQPGWGLGLGVWCLMPLSTIFLSYIVVVNFIDAENRSTWRKPLTCRKLLFTTNCLCTVWVSTRLGGEGWGAWSYSSWIYNYLHNLCLSPLAYAPHPSPPNLVETQTVHKQLVVNRWDIKAQVRL
jgi:hypothetical protein